MWKLIELGTDEVTLVIKPKIHFDKDKILESDIMVDWQAMAEYIILKFEDNSQIIDFFGERTIEQRPPHGYTIAYKYGEHNFYFAVAYHPDNASMGVIVKFSAQALDFYCESTGLNIYRFLQKIQDPEYSTRLSRIDFTIDYIDEDVDVSQIYQDLVMRKVGIFREDTSKKADEPFYKRCMLGYRGFVVGDEVPTIYLGSVQSKSELRIYNKKLEQIQRKGTKYEKAVKCDSWTRFEGIFKQEYAHQITEELLKLQNDAEYTELIATAMLQKFRFMKIDNGVVDCATDYTQMIEDCIGAGTFILHSTSTKNYDLTRSIAYIFHGSGVVTTIYKIMEIWGEDAIDLLFDKIKEFLDEREPNEDCRYWLIRNAKDYSRNYPDFKCYFEDSVSLMLPKGADG